MNRRGIGLSPNDRSQIPNRSRSPTETDVELRQITDFWNEIRVCEELGATTWGVLEPLERRVTDALRRSPPDLGSAREATAKALILIYGVQEL